jgi:hypothetical protein
MRRHLKWWSVTAGLLLALVGLSFYRQAQQPIALGHTLADALRHDGFSAYLRPALPIVDYASDEKTGEKATDDSPASYQLSTQPADARRNDIARLLDKPDVAATLARQLDRQGYYHDFAVNLVQNARDHLQRLPAEELLNRIITADVALLENDSDPEGSIQTALLLTALQPSGAVGCAKFSGPTIYVMPLADDNGPDRPNYLLTLYAFSPGGQEVWAGTLQVPRGWSPEQIDGVLQGIR